MLLSPVMIWMVAAAALAAGFALLFGWTRRIHNFGYVDVGWAAAFSGIGAWFALTGGAPGWRRIALAAAVGAWALRLAVHLGRRVAAHHPVEDGRYVALRRAWAEHLDLKMAAFFQAQAVSVLVLAAPLYAIAGNPMPGWQPAELLGAGVVVLAITGEAIADRQLCGFQRRHPDRRQVCAEGLWRYSRHPNYFFEWLVWVGFALWAWPAPHGAVGLVSPAIMLFLLLKVTGIRYTEEQLERSKGEAYRRYRARTSAFVPWPPRRPAAPRL